MDRFGEFCAYLIMAAIVSMLLALSVSVTYWSLTWAFGLR